MNSHTEEPNQAPDVVGPTGGPADGSKTAGWGQFKPWTGKAHPMDKFLLIAPLVAVALMMASKPLQPFWLATQPLLLAAVTGSNLSVGAAAAFASVNGASLVPVVVAGVVGSLKFHWLFWLAGRRWGEKAIALIIPGERGRERAAALRGRRGLVAVAASLGEFPGVPSVLVHMIAGWQKMSFLSWAVWTTLGASVWVGLVAVLGYTIGQPAVDLVLLIDRYALWVSLAMVLGMVLLSTRASGRNRAPKSPTVSEESRES